MAPAAGPFDAGPRGQKATEFGFPPSAEVFADRLQSMHAGQVPKAL